MLDVPKCKQKCKHETYNQQIVSSKESQIIILSSVEKLYYWVQSGSRTVLVRSSTRIVLRTSEDEVNRQEMGGEQNENELVSEH